MGETQMEEESAQPRAVLLSIAATYAKILYTIETVHASRGGFLFFHVFCCFSFCRRLYVAPRLLKQPWRVTAAACGPQVFLPAAGNSRRACRAVCSESKGQHTLIRCLLPAE